MTTQAVMDMLKSVERELKQEVDRAREIRDRAKDDSDKAVARFQGAKQRLDDFQAMMVAVEALP